MKPRLYAVLFAFVLAACQKETKNNPSDVFTAVQQQLRDSLSTSDYQRLVFSNSYTLKIDSLSITLLKIPFQDKEFNHDFVILQIGKDGQVLKGKIIHMEGADTVVLKGRNEARTYNGSIEISSLNRQNRFYSPIRDGYIETFHPEMNTRTEVLMAPDVLPEVVVVAYVSSGVSYSDWMLLQSFFYDSGGFGGGGGIGGTGTTGGGGGGYYGPLSSGGGSGSYGTPASGGSQAPVISVDIENGVSLPAIDIQKYMNCFSSIPDAGATCSIEILTNIPVDGDPSKFFNWHAGSPGHTFLKLKKQNGSQSVQQVFGWYPASSWSVIPSPAPVPGKFVDNSYHEYNASYTVNITPAQLQSAITEVLYLARFIKYDIDEYNCTDFALEVFNYVMSPVNQLTIQKYDIPGGESPTGTSTPNGLYLKLQQMQKAGGLNASNIEVPGVKGWVGPSHGPCN